MNIAGSLRQVRETADFTKSSKTKNARITKLTWNAAPEGQYVRSETLKMQPSRNPDVTLSSTKSQISKPITEESWQQRFYKDTLTVEIVDLRGFQLSNQKRKLTRSRSWAFQIEKWRSLLTKREEFLFTESQSAKVLFSSTWMRIRTTNSFTIMILIVWTPHEQTSLACMFCFPNVGHVILFQRTPAVFFVSLPPKMWYVEVQCCLKCTDP